MLEINAILISSETEKGYFVPPYTDLLSSFLTLNDVLKYIIKYNLIGIVKSKYTRINRRFIQKCAKNAGLNVLESLS